MIIMLGVKIVLCLLLRYSVYTTGLESARNYFAIGESLFDKNVHDFLQTHQSYYNYLLIDPS